MIKLKDILHNNKEILKESLTNLDPLIDGISRSTITGKHWTSLISSLESVIDEVNNFPSSFSSSRHGPLPNS